MAYEIFTRKRSRISTPAVSISSTGRIGLNQGSSAIFQKNAIQFVLLLWDADEHRMALRAIVKKDARAYGVSYAKSCAMFSAKTFFEHIGYQMTETRSFPAMWNETENILEINIPAEHFKQEQQGKLLSLDKTGTR
jgi:hypothetical protein